MSKPSSPRYTFRSVLLRRMFVAVLLLAQLVTIVFSTIYYSKMRWVSDLLYAFSFITALHLVTHRRSATLKISMIFLILLFPLFGGVFYWIFHFQTTTVGFRKRLRKYQRATEHAFICKSAPARETAQRIPESEKLVRYLNTVPRFPVYANTETVYYPDGKPFLEALLAELKQAKRYIFLEFFIIGEGVFWDSILETLRERARAGVDVRVIYDDLGCFATLPHKYAKKLRSMGIQCKVFNPFRPFLTSIQNNRDHRKIAVIDGKVAFTGGINLADEYINARVRFGHWKDSAIKLSGDGAWSLTVMFLQMWSFLCGREENPEGYLPTAPSPFNAPALGWVQPYADSPMDREPVGEQVYLQIIGNARRYLYITTPYFMVDDDLLSALKLASKSGVDVRIILPHKPDKRMVHFTSRSYYHEMIRSGIRVYEYTEGFVHSKIMISDDLVASVGTVNLDFRSLYMHFECGTCLYRTPSLPSIRDDFLATLEHCHRVTLSECRANPFKKLLQDICRLLAPMM